MITRTRRRATAIALASASALALMLSACTTQKTGDDGKTDEGTSEAAGDLSSVKIAFVPGGAHPYFQPWVDGAQAAVDEFGVGGFTFNETGEWDQTKQNAAIDSLGAQGYNAFGIFGVSPTDINSTFLSLKDKGLSVASVASCPEGDVNEALYCLSTDTREAAYLAATATIEAMGGEGAIVHLTGNAVDSNTQRRIEGVQQAIDEAGGKVTLLQTITDIDVDLQSAQKAVDDLLASQGDKVGGIVTTAYNPAVAATQGVANSGLDIKVVGIDDDATILNAIKDGTITGTVVQNPWGQAYVSTWALANIHAGLCTVNDPGVIIDSGSFLVTKDNVDNYDDERRSKTDEILKEFQNGLLTCK